MKFYRTGKLPVIPAPIGYGVECLRNAIDFPILHTSEFASARARRQGTGVPGLLREAPNKNLELMMESI